MGSFSIWHWLVVLCVVLLLFGGGKVSSLMGDFAKGIKAFKKNMQDDDDASMAATTAERPAPTIAPPQQASQSGAAPQATAAQREATAAH